MYWFQLILCQNQFLHSWSSIKCAFSNLLDLIVAQISGRRQPETIRKAFVFYSKHTSSHWKDDGRKDRREVGYMHLSGYLGKHAVSKERIQKFRSTPNLLTLLTKNQTNNQTKNQHRTDNQEYLNPQIYQLSYLISLLLIRVSDPYKWFSNIWFMFLNFWRLLRLGALQLNQLPLKQLPPHIEIWSPFI